MIRKIVFWYLLLLLTLAGNISAQTLNTCPDTSPLVAPVGVPVRVIVCQPIRLADGTLQSIQRVLVTVDGVAVWEGAANRETYTYDPVTGIVPFVAGPIVLTAGSHQLGAQVAIQASRTLADGTVVSETLWSPITSRVVNGDGGTPPPLPPPCTFTLNIPVSTDPIAAAGGQGIFGVQASATNCQWSLGNSSTWLTLTPTNGTGSVAVSFTAAPNTSTSPRTAMLAFAGSSVTYNVSQSGAAQPPPPPPPTDTEAPDVYDLTYRRSGNSPNFNFSVKTRATDVAHVYLYIGAVEAAHLTHQSTSYTMYTTIRTAGTYLVRVEVRDTSGNVGTASMTVVRR